MVAFFFGNCPSAIDEVEGLLEVGEFEDPVQVMILQSGPLRDVLDELFDRGGLQSGNTTAARDAFLVG